MNKGAIESITNIYNRLCDEESKNVFKAKFDLILYKNEDKFLEWFLSENERINCPELDQYENGKNKKYIIFGAGLEGRRASKILKASNRNIFAWCDNNKMLWGTQIDGVKVLSPEELINEYREFTIIISARKYIFQIYQQLLMIGFSRENIFVPENGFLMGIAGKQYFDVFKPQKDEVFMDLGCWDGNTSKEFVHWCNRDYRHIYAFEPDASCWSRCENTFLTEKITNVSFIRKGIWKDTEELYFHGVGNGNSIVSSKEISVYKVPVTSIDDVLKADNRKVTFIKMDVEGSEMEALIGGKESIRKYKPKLAVSIYHKPQDLWELADYILDLNADYKLFMRHYTTCSYETVLYAV